MCATVATGRRERVGVGQLLASMLLAACPSGFALDPSLDVSQYDSWSELLEVFPCTSLAC